MRQNTARSHTVGKISGSPMRCASSLSSFPAHRKSKANPAKATKPTSPGIVTSSKASTPLGFIRILWVLDKTCGRLVDCWHFIQVLVPPHVVPFSSDLFHWVYGSGFGPQKALNSGCTGRIWWLVGICRIRLPMRRASSPGAEVLPQGCSGRRSRPGRGERRIQGTSTPERTGL